MFADRRSDLWFMRALGEELRLCGGTVPFSEHHLDRMLEAGMRAIANGAIGVGSVLPDGLVVTFDEERPWEWYKFASVVFPSQVIIEHVASNLMRTLANRRAFEAALEHPIGRGRATEPPRQDAAGHVGARTDTSDVLAVRVAWLLATRRLALIPRDLSRRRLRLVWLEHQMAIAPAVTAPAPSPSPSPSPAPAPAPSNAPASVLPAAPDDLSPQAQALIDAADKGAPFCEECARLAAEQSDAELEPASNALASVLPDEADDLLPQAQAQALIDAANKGLPFCAECARQAAQQAAMELSNA
jgi:hypothetical protein